MTQNSNCKTSLETTSLDRQVVSSNDENSNNFNSAKAAHTYTNLWPGYHSDSYALLTYLCVYLLSCVYLMGVLVCLWRPAVNIRMSVLFVDTVCHWFKVH